MVIETNDLTKKYNDMFAIRSIQLRLNEGDIFGFIGPNGAGKTTTMRIIATLLEPSWGEASVCGHSIYENPREIRRLVGYMPDIFGVYDDMKVIEYLEFFAAAFRINGSRRKERCEEMLEIVDLAFKRDAYANTLSRGQTQRLGLARVLLHDPQVLLLDEPLSGLDPRARIEMRNLLRQLGEMGKTVIVSSHILPELADVCNKVGIIDRGVLSVNAEVSEVMKQVREKTVLYIQIKKDQQKGLADLQKHPLVEVAEIEKEKIRVVVPGESPKFEQLLPYLFEAGHEVLHFAEETVSLEAAFMSLTKGTGEKI
ncbi:MAG: ABC transporter ATP-binding protein [Pirellulaceae bacterium]|nr:ABC transporter ATP-binding protein [Pirellulaceae bacterium]